MSELPFVRLMTVPDGQGLRSDSGEASYRPALIIAFFFVYNVLFIFGTAFADPFPLVGYVSELPFVRLMTGSP